jgi:Rrf2 family protein
MSVLFSRRCDYALQAVLYVALRDEGDLTTIRELTETLGIPYHFLAKILQDLSRKGLLKSHKGPRGGFALGNRADEITLLDIVDAIDGAGLENTCVLGFHECSAGDPCAVHEKWTGIRDQVKEMFASRSISQVAREMRKPGYAHTVAKREK